MTETDDSEYEDPNDRANRLYVESCNYDLSEGMTPMTYTPPLRKNRRRRYEIRKNKGPDIKESISGTSDQGCRTDEESPSPEQTIESGTAGDNVYTATLRDDKDTHRHNELNGLTGYGAYSSTSELWEIVDRPVTEWDMARSGIKTDFPCQGHSELANRPVTESVSAREGKEIRSFPVTNI